MFTVEPTRERECTSIYTYIYDSFAFLLRNKEIPEKPDIPWLTPHQWKICCQLQDMLPSFKGLVTDIVSTPVHCKMGQLEVRSLLVHSYIAKQPFMC